MLDVLLAGPDHFHRAVNLLGDADGLRDEIDLQAPAESAAQVMVVHHHFRKRQAGRLGGYRLCARKDLRARPHFATIGPDVHRAIDRLHRRVREEGGLVHRFELVRRARGDGGRIALVPHHHARRQRSRREPRDDVIGIDGSIRSVVPLNDERPEALLRRPHIVGHDGDCVVEADDLAHSLDRFRLAVVDADHLAADHRTRGDRGDLHPRQPDVDAVHRGAVDLGRRIEPLCGRADQDEVLRVLERDLGRYGQL